MRDDKVRTDRPSIFARRRIRLAFTLLAGALVPWLARGPLLPGTMLDPASLNGLMGNAVAIVIAFWMRLSIGTYPGIRRSTVIIPSALTGHGLVVVWFLLTRFPYDRVALAGGFLLNVLSLYLMYLYAGRRAGARIAVVPFGGVERLYAIDQVDWVPLTQPVLGQADRFDSIVADFSTELPDEWEAFLADAALAGRIVYQHKQLGESLTGRVELEHLSENSFGSLVPARGYFYLKALIDFVCAVAMLPIALPVMAAVAIAIRIDAGSPVLFRQRRLGHAGMIFTAYKFRTMTDIPVPDGDDEVRRALATDESDPRITRVGKVLRKYRLDELPQLFNILKGDMSFIGPRPEPEVLTRWFVAEIPFYRYRHVVKPGISGWAQVNQGYVSGVQGIHRKLQYDFYYIKYFSPWLDLLILFRTVKTMLTGFGSR